MTDTTTTPPFGAASAPASNAINPHYTGEGGEMFGLAAKTSFLTLITAGIYRFWAKTRIRRYIWSSTTVEGDAFQYTGTGVEKLLGFLVAVIILAFALGILQIGLFFMGLSFFSPTDGDPFAIQAQIAAAYASLIFLAPLFFFARYRSLRYKLARTRWRGIRFALAPGAWGYAWRGVLYSILSIITLGLLLPLQTFKLTKYRTDRTWFGDAKMSLNGKWTSLYRAMLHLIIGIALVIVGGVMMGFSAETNFGEPTGLSIAVFVIGYIWLFVGGVYFRVDSFRRLTAMSKLGDDISFASGATTGTVILRVILGGLLIGVIYAIFAAIAVGLLASSFDFVNGPSEPPVGTIVGLVIMGVVFLLLISATSMAVIIQPIIAMVVNTITVKNPGALDGIRQRDEDNQVDADGLADALDFGGAI